MARSLRKIFKVRRRHLRLIWSLRQRNTLRTIVGMMACEAMGRRRVFRCSVAGEDLLVRTATEDVNIAQSCLRGEFDAALSCVRDPTGLVVDAGGYIGTAAIVFARALPKATILCLEPSPENVELCRRNTSGFDNIVVWQVALTARPGRRALHTRKKGAEGYSLVAEPADSPDSRRVATVECVDIRTILAHFQRPSIELLKLDIEGGEKELLADGESWIPATRIVFAELHDRIVGGCSQSFHEAMQGRRIVAGDGEKILSIRA